MKSINKIGNKGEEEEEEYYDDRYSNSCDQRLSRYARSALEEVFIYLHSISRVSNFRLYKIKSSFTPRTTMMMTMMITIITAHLRNREIFIWTLRITKAKGRTGGDVNTTGRFDYYYFDISSHQQHMLYFRCLTARKKSICI
jgi:hypothetical protein